jgi:hypothetical protein
VYCFDAERVKKTKIGDAAVSACWRQTQSTVGPGKIGEVGDFSDLPR